MKGLKCYILSLLFFIMLGLSFVVSSDVSALKHEYSNLFIPGFKYNDSNGILTVRSPLKSSYPKSGSISSPTLKSQPLLCSSNSYSSLYSNDSTLMNSLRSDFYFNVGLTQPCFNDSSSAWYHYSGYQISPLEGQYSTSATIQDIFSSSNFSSRNIMYSFELPLTFNTDSVGPITAGRSFHFHVSFTSSNSFLNSDSSPYWFNSPVVLTFSGVRSDYSTVDTFSYDFNSSSDTNYCTNLVRSADSNSVFADCYFTPSISYSKFSTFGITFLPYGYSSSNPSSITPLVWSSESDHIFLRDFYVITDNDSTPGPDASFPLSGTDLSDSPTAEGTTGASYPNVLANLFNFGFFNPFQPLFNLFATDNSCASIPTISSWLHTEDTEVCHFFPTSVRNVLTPIFGLASAMLIFGFAVRWLGSSSGNFFEDTSAETLGYSDRSGFKPRLSYHSGQRRFNK